MSNYAVLLEAGACAEPGRERAADELDRARPRRPPRGRDADDACAAYVPQRASVPRDAASAAGGTEAGQHGLALPPVLHPQRACCATEPWTGGVMRWMSSPASGAGAPCSSERCSSALSWPRRRFPLSGPSCTTAVIATTTRAAADSASSARRPIAVAKPTHARLGQCSGMTPDDRYLEPGVHGLSPPVHRPIGESGKGSNPVY
jgi:hypothetical protein